MKKLVGILVLVVSIFANENTDFLKTLNEVSEIATNSKLNINKTPSNVDIIERDFILKSNAKTLLDLLRHIPGVELSISSSGKKELIIRGFKSTYRDKIKLLINGIEVTNSLYNNQFYYYNFPASLIKRIEFTKTPDSILYGENAFLGVINVITVDEMDDNFINSYGTNKNQYKASLFQKFKNDTVLLDMYYSYSNPKVKSPKTYAIDIINKNAHIIRNEQSANTLEKNFGLGIKTYLNENNTLTYRIQYYKKGNFFGIMRVTPLTHDKYIEMIHQYIDFKHKNFISYDKENTFEINAKLYKWRGSYRTFPYDFNKNPNPSNPYNDLISGASINEYDLYIKNLFKIINDTHNFSFLIESKYSKPFDYYYIQYVPSMGNIANALNLGPNGKHLTGKKNALKSGIYTFYYATSVEDLITLNKKLALIAGLRFDKYINFNKNISYRMGSVFNFNNDNTFKILFNTAFRIPSWVELYSQSAAGFNGNENLNSEKINMLELIYIHNFTQNDLLKIVAYKGKNKNVIGRVINLKTGSKVYENLGTTNIKGIEISYKKLLKNAEFYISYSKNDNKNNFSQCIGDINLYDYPGKRDNLIKSYFQYDINKKLSLYTSLHYGSKIKVPHYANDVNSYFSLNANISYKTNNTLFKFGIDNITNHKNYAWIDPSEIIYGKYMLEVDNAEVPIDERKIFFSIQKSWE